MFNGGFQIEFYYSLWLILSILYLAAGIGFYRWAVFLKPNGKPIYLFALVFLIYAAFGLITTGIGFYRASYGFNDAFTSLGWLGHLRMGMNFIFAGSLAIASNWIAIRANSLPPLEKETVIKAVRIFRGLQNAIHKTES